MQDMTTIVRHRRAEEGSGISPNRSDSEPAGRLTSSGIIDNSSGFLYGSQNCPPYANGVTNPLGSSMLSSVQLPNSFANRASWQASFTPGLYNKKADYTNGITHPIELGDDYTKGKMARISGLHRKLSIVGVLVLMIAFGLLLGPVSSFREQVSTNIAHSERLETVESENTERQREIDQSILSEASVQNKEGAHEVQILDEDALAEAAIKSWRQNSDVDGNKEMGSWELTGDDTSEDSESNGGDDMDLTSVLPDVSIIEKRKSGYNPLASGEKRFANHHAIFNKISQWRGHFQKGFVTDWLGVRTRHSFLCTGNGGRFDNRFIASRRLPCEDYNRRISTQPQSIAGFMPVFDEEYFTYTDLMKAASRSNGSFNIADLGAGFGYWGIRSAMIYKRIHEDDDYHVIAVEPDTPQWVEDFVKDNNIKNVDVLVSGVASLSDFSQVLSNYTGVIDFAHMDVQGGESEIANQILAMDDSTLSTDDTIQAITNRIGRLHVHSHSPEGHNVLRGAFEKLGWTITLDIAYNSLQTICDQMVSEFYESFYVPEVCSIATPYGPIYVKDGIVAAVNPNVLGSVEASKLPKLKVELNSALEAAHKIKNNEAFDWEDMGKGKRDKEKETLRRMGVNMKVEALERGDYFCESVKIGGSDDKSPGSHASAQQTSFKYCTISYRTGCPQPPCIETGKRNQKWPQPVLWAGFFFNHTMELQVADAFLRQLSAKKKNKGVVLDIGSNTGFFSQLSASLGYTVHAIDVQPLCSRHVLTSSIENGFEDKVWVHNIGLSTVPGEMQMLVDQCKGGLSFNTSEAGKEEDIIKKGHVVQHKMIPLMKLSDFINDKIGVNAGVEMMKMDTEGSECDILRSSLSIFRQGRVRSLVVELGVRHWQSEKGISLDEGIALLEEIRLYFDHVYLFSDPKLPVGKIVHKIPDEELPLGMRGPMFTFTSFRNLVYDRFEKQHDCNLFFFRE